jgi:exopolysaccharide production protein ExoZ
MMPAKAPSTEIASPGMKLYSIQYLRGLAAAAVVVSHAANSLLGRESHLIDLDYGAYGVDVFFVVSGFVMYYTTYDANASAGTFLIKRLIRIFPLYLLLSTAMWVLVRLSPASFNQESPDWLAYVQSVLFIPHWNPRLHNLEPIIGQGWTLNYEMFFYVLFAASLLIRHRLNSLAVLPAIGALVFCGALFPPEHPAAITYTSPLMLEFCLGIVVAASFTVPPPANRRWPIALIALLGAGTFYLYAFHAASHGSEALRPLFAGVPCALLVALSVAIERRGWLPNIGFLALLGDASYSLYLDHGFVLGFLKRLWKHLFPVDTIASHAVFIVLNLAVSALVALLIYRYLELKITRNLNSLLRHA